MTGAHPWRVELIWTEGLYRHTHCYMIFLYVMFDTDKKVEICIIASSILPSTIIYITHSRTRGLHLYIGWCQSSVRILRFNRYCTITVVKRRTMNKATITHISKTVCYYIPAKFNLIINKLFNLLDNLLCCCFGFYYCYC